MGEKNSALKTLYLRVKVTSWIKKVKELPTEAENLCRRMCIIVLGNIHTDKDTNYSITKYLTGSNSLSGTVHRSSYFIHWEQAWIFGIAIIYSPMPSLRAGDLGSLVNDICETPT